MKMTNAVALSVLLGGCAPQVVRDPVSIAAPAAAARQYVLDQRVSVTLDTWYMRAVDAGASFAEAGTIPQGQVLRPTSTVLSVEGDHVYEAYVVVRGGSLVGFYLPVQRAFTPLSNPVPFPLSERRQP